MSGPATDGEMELARQAKESFDNHRYESCLSALNKLQESRRTDGRVAHNRAVAQYFLSNLTLTDVFRKSLQSVNAQVATVLCTPVQLSCNCSASYSPAFHFFRTMVGLFFKSVLISSGVSLV